MVYDYLRNSFLIAKKKRGPAAGVILLLLFCSVVSAQVPDIVTPLLKNVTRVVIWGADGEGSNYNNILRFGVGLSITPTSLSDTTNTEGDTIQVGGRLYASTLMPVTDTIKSGTHKLSRTYTLLIVDNDEKKVILKRIGERERRLQNHFAISIGYENFALCHVKIDSSNSDSPVSGFYAGAFYNFLSGASIGCTLGLFTISGATATIGNPINPLPIKYSSETALSPELYIGQSINKWLFIELSYKYLNFNSITYIPTNGGIIGQSEYAQLPNHINLSSVHITIGLSIPLGFASFTSR
ncbi:MAG TPA: hypothetical protein VK783_01430 [Bacteroidia bacterium]|jgi:hypothetical protein|nr:hypothetical protein [Bacteroidia bacterium]